MPNSNERIERRRCRRFAVREGVIFLDSLQGELIDLSFGGLAFRYAAASGAGGGEGLETGVLFGGEELFLENVALRTVSDQPLRGAGPEGLRRRGMAFGPLSSEELAALARFIRLFALDPDGERDPLPAS
jgi:hypothetical protein